MCLLYSSGARLMASVPPARMMSALPLCISSAPLSIAWSPDAQFLCTL